MARLLGKIRSDLDRVELLMAALSAFAHPIPDYEPGFRHLGHSILQEQGLH